MLFFLFWSVVVDLIIMLLLFVRKKKQHRTLLWMIFCQMIPCFLIFLIVYHTKLIPTKGCWMCVCKSNAKLYSQKYLRCDCQYHTMQATSSNPQRGLVFTKSRKKKTDIPLLVWTHYSAQNVVCVHIFKKITRSLLVIN